MLGHARGRTDSMRPETDERDTSTPRNLRLSTMVKPETSETKEGDSDKNRSTTPEKEFVTARRSVKMKPISIPEPDDKDKEKDKDKDKDGFSSSRRSISRKLTATSKSKSDENSTPEKKDKSARRSTTTVIENLDKSPESPRKDKSRGTLTRRSSASNNKKTPKNRWKSTVDEALERSLLSWDKSFPGDFEKIIQNLSSSSPRQRLFLDTDLFIKAIPQIHSIWPDNFSPDGSQFIDVLRIFSGEFAVVYKKNQANGGTVPLSTFVLENCSKPENSENESESTQQSLFELFDGKERTRPTNKRLESTPLKESNKKKLSYHLEFQSINTSLQIKDPLWLVFALYDVSKKVKVSEDFHVEPFAGDKDISALLKVDPNFFDPSTRIKHALFTVPSCDSSLYLVVRVMCALRGDIDDICEPYLTGSINTQEQARWTESLAQSKYKQMMAWSAIPLSEASKSTGTLTTSMNLFKAKPLFTDDILYETLENVDGLRKAKTLDMKILISITPNVDMSTLKLLDSSLFPLPIDSSASKKVPVGFRASKLTPREEPTPVTTKMIHDFTRSPNRPKVQLEHNLYFYPQLINLTNLPSKLGKVKHVSVSIALVRGDEIVDLQVSGFPGIYARLGLNTESNCSTELPVIWDAKRLTFFDEVKIRLPLTPDPLLHLRVSLHHLEKSKKDKSMTEKLIGFCAIPIWVNPNCPIPDGEHNVSLCKDLVPGYLSKKDYIDVGKITCVFNTKLVSSISTQCPILNEFFEKPSNEFDTKLLGRLSEVSTSEKVGNLTRVTNQLMEILCLSPSQNVQQLALRSIVSLFELVATTNPEDYKDILRSYCDFHSSSKQMGQHEKIVTHINLLISEAGISTDARSSLNALLTKFSELFFKLIIKSMVIELKSKNLLDVINRSDRFSKPVNQALLEMIISLGLHSDKTNLNLQVSHFVYDLMDILDRGIIFNMIHRYLPQVDVIQHRIKFLKIICDHSSYVTLCLPGPCKVNCCKGLRYKYWKQHYLAGHVLNQLQLATPNEKERVRAIRTLRNILRKHQFDTRYPDKSILANLYIPFVQLMLSNQQILRGEESDVDEKREWFVCLLWILKNCTTSLIQKWWSLTPLTDILSLLQLFHTCVDAFNHHNLLFPCVQILCTYLSEFLIDFHTHLLIPNGLLMKQLSLLLREIYQHSTKARTEYPTSCKLTTTFFDTFNEAIFSDKSTFVSDWCNSIVASIVDPLADTKKATQLLYNLIRNDYLHNRHFLTTKMALIIAQSKIDKSQFSGFAQALISIQKYAKEDSTNNPAIFTKKWIYHIRDITGRLFRIMDCLQKMEICVHLSKIDYILKLSLEANHSVGQRVYWLNRAASHYTTDSAFEESAHCRLLIAALIAATLKKANNELATCLPDFNAFIVVSSNLKDELPLYSSCLVEPLPVEFFSVDGYVNQLKSSVTDFLSGQLYECAADTLRILSDFYRIIGSWKDMQEVTLRISGICGQVFSANETTSRLFPNFYRVSFFGSSFGSKDKQTYIYRQPSAIRLVDFSTQILSYWQQVTGEEIKTLPNKPKEKLEIDADSHYLQILSVDAWSSLPANSQRSLTPFEKQHNCNSFSFYLPYVPDGGKMSEDVDKQYKLHTICRTKLSFPTFTRFTKVASEENSVIEPIDGAIDLMKSRVEALRAELNPGSTPNTKTLQMLLQGSIMLQVNAGPLAICKTFFAKDSEFLSVATTGPKLDTLRVLLNEFVRLCGAALKLNGHLITHEQDAYQEAMTQAYDQFKLEVAKLV